MSTTPTGRYGKSSATRGDRGLKIAFVVFMVLLVSGTVWIGLNQANPGVHASIPSFNVTSDNSVDVRIEVTKDSGKTAVCVLRSRDSDGAEVGRKELRFPKGESSIDRVEVLQTAGRPNTAELENCRTVD